MGGCFWPSRTLRPGRIYAGFSAIDPGPATTVAALVCGILAGTPPPRNRPSRPCGGGGPTARLHRQSGRRFLQQSDLRQKGKGAFEVVEVAQVNVRSLDIGEGCQSLGRGHIGDQGVLEGALGEVGLGVGAE